MFFQEWLLSVYGFASTFLLFFPFFEWKSVCKTADLFNIPLLFIVCLFGGTINASCFSVDTSLPIQGICGLFIYLACFP